MLDGVSAKARSDGDQDGLDGVFKALASSHRRQILDLLAVGPRSTGEIADEFELSRFAVMQHLGVLTEAGLVAVQREGRRRINYLNAVPLREIYEKWISPVADEHAARALALKRFVERKEKP